MPEAPSFHSTLAESITAELRMGAPPNIIHRLGARTIDRARIFLSITHILTKTVGATLHLAFLNRAVFLILVRQIYFTAVQPIPLVCIAGLLLGSIAVHNLLNFLTSVGAYDEIGYYLTRTMLHELAPVTTSLLISIRSGPAVTSELALMKINNELDTLRVLSIPPERYLYLPRLAAFAFAGPSLSLIFAFVGLIGSFFILGYFHDITFDNYLDQIFYSLEFKSLIVLLTKPFFMGVMAALVAMARGLAVRKTITEVPIRLIQAIVHTIISILFVEILYLFFV